MNIKNLFSLQKLASVQLTLICMGLATILILIGTLAQVKMGAFAAQRIFFNSWLIWKDLGPLALPLFPGGLLIGSLWVINLLAAFAVRFKFRKKEAGILTSHFGVILLMIGQLITQLAAKESNMPIEIGQTSNYSESLQETELAVVMTSDSEMDEVTSIPYSYFSRTGPIPTNGLPFTLNIKRFFPNAELKMSPAPDSPVNRGIGTRIAVQEVAVTHSDEEANIVSAYVEVMEGAKSLGTWLLSMGMGAPQTFEAGGKQYAFSIRPKRYYYPFQLTLKDFRHDKYAGTDIPKNFSSLVQLKNPQTGEWRDVLIYMNNPLRYEGKTFYQASFGKGDRLSVLQVVDNPVAWAPYVACTLVALGLAMQFMTHLLAFTRRRS